MEVINMTFDFINAIIHLLYENPDVFITTLFSSIPTHHEMKKWMMDQNIDFQWLKRIKEDDLPLLTGRKEVIQIEALLRMDIQGELDAFIVKNRSETHYLLFPGKNQQDPINQCFIDQHYIETLQKQCPGMIFYPPEPYDEDRYMFSNPAHSLMQALFNADQWPGILKIHDDEICFIPIHSKDEMECVILRGLVSQEKPDETFFIHLSDLHLGSKKHNSGATALIRALDHLYPSLPKENQTKILITGDLMNSPNRKNMYLASGLMNDLKKRYKADISFILGNHDVIVHGLNLLRVQKAKVVAYLLGENIKVLEKEKIIIIKINSAYEGNLARGKVGIQQLEEIDEELSAITDLDSYQLMVMIHHHVFPIDKADFLKKKWNEKKVLRKIVETSKELVDSDILIDWLEKRHVQYILHGHKHIPYFRKYHQFYVISCGSSCGYLKESKMKYLSYNILKYDNQTHQMKVCLICYEAANGNEGRRIEVHLFK